MGTQTEIDSVKAALKRHSCSWCGESIETGQPYLRWRWYSSGDAWTVKMHPECKPAMDELRSLEGGSEIEFYPGDSPRGCCCGHDKGCLKCAERKQKVSNAM